MALSCISPDNSRKETDHSIAQSKRSEGPHPPKDPEWVPTVLIAAEQELRNAVVPALEAEGYLVFEARNAAEALHIVVTHSRLIHILLADVALNGDNLVEALCAYRSEMRAFLITTHSHHFLDALSPTGALMKVRQQLELPKGIAKQGAANGKARAHVIGMSA